MGRATSRTTRRRSTTICGPGARTCRACATASSASASGTGTTPRAACCPRRPRSNGASSGWPSSGKGTEPRFNPPTEVRILKWAGGLVLLLAVALVLLIAFGLNTLRGPITRAVTNATGRELRIEGDLKPLWSWLYPGFRAEKVSFANPDWASEDYLFRADALEASIALLPLLRGRVVVPKMHLQRPEVFLERDAEGRKNWLLDREPDGSRASRVQKIGRA